MVHLVLATAYNNALPNRARSLQVYPARHLITLITLRYKDEVFL